MTARVSVISAVRNGSEFLESFRAQLAALTYPELELLLVDDASTDETTDVLREWAAADPRVRLMRNEERLGVARSRNRALDEVTGTYIWFTDCDDEWDPAIVDRMVAAAEPVDADLAICGARRARIDDRTHEADIPGPAGPPVRDAEDAARRLMRGQIQGHLWNKLFHRRLFTDIRFPPTRAFSDLGAVGPLLCLAQRTVLVDERLYTYLIRPGSLLNSKHGRAQDLLDVQARMHEAVDEMPQSPGLARDLVRYDYTLIYVPALNTMIRGAALDESDKALRRRIQHSMNARGCLLLLRSGLPRDAVAAAAMKWCYPAYEGAYKAFRRVRWGSAGAWGG